MTSCGSFSSAEFEKHRACLIDMNGRGTFRTGWVIEKRESDSALLFKFDDSTAGDHGYMWVVVGEAPRLLRRCQAAQPFGDISGRQPPPLPDGKRD